MEHNYEAISRLPTSQIITSTSHLFMTHRGKTTVTNSFFETYDAVYAPTMKMLRESLHKANRSAYLRRNAKVFPDNSLPSVSGVGKCPTTAKSIQRSRQQQKKISKIWRKLIKSLVNFKKEFQKSFIKFIDVNKNYSKCTSLCCDFPISFTTSLFHFFSTLLKQLKNRVGWLDDRHGPSQILYDTAPLFVYTDQPLRHCIFICSNVH